MPVWPRIRSRCGEGCHLCPVFDRADCTGSRRVGDHAWVTTHGGPRVGHDAWGMARSTSSPVETDGWTASDETEIQAHSVGSAECNEAPMNPRGNRARPSAVRATRAPSDARQEPIAASSSFALCPPLPGPILRGRRPVPQPASRAPLRQGRRWESTEHRIPHRAQSPPQAGLLVPSKHGLPLKPLLQTDSPWV